MSWVGRSARGLQLQDSKPNVETLVLRDNWNTLENVTLGIMVYKGFWCQMIWLWVLALPLIRFDLSVSSSKRDKVTLLCPSSPPLSFAPHHPDSLPLPWIYTEHPLCFRDGFRCGDVNEKLQYGRCYNGEVYHI